MGLNFHARRVPLAPDTAVSPAALPADAAPSIIVVPPLPWRAANSPSVEALHDQILARIEPAVVMRTKRADLKALVERLVAEIANERRLLLNQSEQRLIASNIVDDMVALGPLEPLLLDNEVSDILVNGARQVFVERHGKLDLTDVQFRNDAHVLHVAQRIASSVGRRVDEFESDAGRAAGRRQPRKCHHSAPEPARAVHLDP